MTDAGRGAATRRAIAAAALAVAASGTPAEPRTYVFDPAHSWVQFELSHFGTSTVRGRLGPVSGNATLDREAGRGEIGARVETASVSTGLAVFDARIRRADLLASEEHPTAWFVARDLRFEGNALAELSGEFTLRGTSRTLALRAERFNCYEHPSLKREVCGGDFVATIRRSDFGMSFGLPVVGDEVTLRMQVEAVRQP